jgi:hypothetical protein
LITSSENNMKTVSGLEMMIMWGASLIFFPLGPPVNFWTVLLAVSDGASHCKTGCGCFVAHVVIVLIAKLVIVVVLVPHLAFLLLHALE